MSAYYEICSCHEVTWGMSVYSADVEFWHQLSTGVAPDKTFGSRCRAAADRIRQWSEETLPFADWLTLIQNGGFVRKLVILCRLIFIASHN